MKRKNAAGRGTKQPAKALRRKVAAGVRPLRAAAQARSARPDPEAQLKDRSRELNAARDQLTAMSDVLRVISSSPGDLKPVFETILANAVRICGARFGNMSLVDGAGLRMVAMHNAPREFEKLRKGSPLIPLESSPLGTLYRTKKVLNIADLGAEKAYKNSGLVKVARARAALCVPMLKDKELIGALVIYRREPGPFSDTQVGLLTSFASQGVIAIENARLLNELRQRSTDLTESLEQQTATSAVLATISSSPGDLQSVFRSILTNAIRICEAKFGVLTRYDGKALVLAAWEGVPPDYLKLLQSTPIPVDEGTVTGRAAKTKQVIHVADITAEPPRTKDDSLRARLVELGGVRTMLAVPMLKEGQLVGAISIYRQEVRPFSDKQIGLVQNFAAQAVIAIENARLLSELRESLAQQTATGKVLQVISGSAFNLQMVFDTLTESAARLCEADAAAIWRPDSGVLKVVAIYGGISTEFVEYARQNPITPSRATISGRAILEGKTVHIPDLLADSEMVSGYQSTGNYRSGLGVPLSRQGETIGVFVLVRFDARPFTEKQIELVTTFADQAVIAIENVRLFEAEQERTRELRESLEQQTASADVLRVISSSPGDLQPVFAVMLENAVRICGAKLGNLFVREGDFFRIVATQGAPQAYMDYLHGERVFRADPRVGLGQLIHTKQPYHIADLTSAPTYDEKLRVATIELAGARSVVCVPMLKDGEVAGGIVVYRQEVRPFTDKQIGLLQNFAAQAVIAIENARLLSELRESLAQQTATADVLKVISGSAFDLQTVLDTLVASAARLCTADKCAILQRDGEVLEVAASHGFAAALKDYSQQNPLRVDRGSLTGRAMLEGRAVHVADVLADPEYQARGYQAFGYRTGLAVPLVREGTTTIGVFFLARDEVSPFNDKQIELVTTFADQAVIAIENVRLFEAEQQRTRELIESLEQQTATSEVLRVISSSPGDVEPVFQAILANATHLCDATFGILPLYEGGENFRVAAMYNAPPAFADLRRREPVFRTARTTRMAVTKQICHVPDILADQGGDDPDASKFAKLTGARSLLVVPMLKDEHLVGGIAIYRQEVRPFTDKQIKLVQNFAAQAVIAIENARLLSELRQRTADLTESLEQQTATSDVLQVISSSPGDLQPVFAAVLENAVRICDATFGGLFVCEEDAFRAVALHNAPPGFAELRKREPVFRPGPMNPLGRAAATKQPVHVADLIMYAADAEGETDMTAFARLSGARSVLTVPMLKEDQAIGVISIYRQEVRTFTDKQIELVKNFAAQAVIAIENARLLAELRQRTTDLTESLEQQTATSDVLRVISSSPGELAPVFGALLENATRLCQAQFAGLFLSAADGLRNVATHGGTSPIFDLLKRAPAVLFSEHPHLPLVRAAQAKQVVHITDVFADPSYIERDPNMVRLVETTGARTVLIMPMLKEDELVGVIGTYRQEVRPFTDKQIELLQNFAAQAVIAIENARLLSELRQRTADLTESLEQQTATAKVLEVISRSAFDLHAVFETVVESSARLCGADRAFIFRFDGELLRGAASYNATPEFMDWVTQHPIRPGRHSAAARAALERRTIHITDAQADPEYSYGVGQKGVEAFRTLLGVPILKGDELLGTMVIYHLEVRPFTEKQIALVKTFADQAAIAIENVRLFEAEQQRTRELTESLEQQTATSDVLRVISSSPGEVAPVFEAMLANATRLCQADFGGLFLREGDVMHIGAAHMPKSVAPLYPQGMTISLDEASAVPVARAARSKELLHIEDLRNDQSYIGRNPRSVRLADTVGARTLLAVPMLKDRQSECIGAFAVFRMEVRPFTDKQIELVKSFAAQAVIAIENARLLTELRESLEQQTATADVLRVISSSPGELEAVFQTILQNATRICGANFGTFNLRDGEAFPVAAMYNMPEAYIELRRRTPRFEISAEHPLGRLATTKAVVHIDDLSAEDGYRDGDPSYHAMVDLAGARTQLVVPMLKEQEIIGAITIFRQEVRPFTDKQIDLVKNFAAQAVIAIENARLLGELRQRTTDLTESLEQQTATSEVLRVISSSPGDLEPVFATMLANAVRICGATFGNIYRWDGDALTLVAKHKIPPAFAAARSPQWRPGARHPIGRMVANKELVHIVDLTSDDSYIGRDPVSVAAVELGGVRTLIVVPMLKENELIGAFALARQEVRPFTDKQIALVTSFAAQAVIAIENTRLLTELRQRTDELGRSVGELRALGEVSQAVNSTLDLETVLSTIVAKAVQLSNTDAGAIYVFDQMDREFHLRATYGMDRELIDALGKEHISLEERNVALVLAQREPVQAPDLREEASNVLNAISLRAGFRARLTAPLIRGRDIVGMLVVRRREPGAFPQTTVDLIKTFAAQSVLAIQNARLFHEIEDKSRELEVAGQHKSQFLANMSHELRTPLNAIIGYSEILQEDVADVGQEGLVPDLKKIEGAGRHLLGLINDILDLSKVEAGRMEVFIEDIEIVPLLEEVRSLIVPLAEKNGNTLEFRVAQNLGTMRTDRTKLKQSLLNILSNGSKFTENGRLTLAAERYADADGRPMMRFAVSDTGIGMHEEQLGRLFQAFSQADASTTKKYGGTGLGLAISRQFCRLLGGDIAVTSRPGEGSTFTITLPVRTDAPAQISPAEAPRLAADVNNATTVLIVDDDPAARELLSASLRTAGYRLVHAASGAEALNLARTVRPDAITLDVIMPKPDGWDVLGALKADPELADIPVVMVTMAPDRGIGLSLGAVDVLTKPVDRARLTALINRLVRREGPILVVEDDADTREMMRHTIERMGHTAAETVNGRLALSWLGEHAAPAMILLDLMMPEMDGFEFLDALAARAEWREIPVIVVTAKQLTAAERERLLRQARKVMEKATATRADIAAAIGEAVRRRPLRVPAGANGNGTGFIS